MKTELEQTVIAACRDLFDATPHVELTRPEELFGDYATNVALQLAKQLGRDPREVGEALAEKLRETLADTVAEVSVAGPGFVNLKLNDAMLTAAMEAEPARTLDRQVVVAEYSDPNPFKILHAGHVYTTIVGDAIANLMELAGGTVHRVNYGGDVGLHVGKTMWSILRETGEDISQLNEDKIPVAERTAWLSRHYVAGNTAYEENETNRAEIIDINRRVYEVHAQGDKQSQFAKIYWKCRKWSYEGFHELYERLAVHPFDKYYPESEVAEAGLAAVKAQLGKVFNESEGAIIFEGEKYGLHTRVFVNRQGLPTYEAKEVGVLLKKQEDYHFDRSLVITANEQEQYMIVMLKAIEQFLPELAEKSAHLPHGMVKLSGGTKMSSRSGNIIPASEVLDLTAAAVQATGREPADTTVLGAIKYSFLKNRLGGDIMYDPAESVSLEGNSGPYLQYAHARARSILRKAEGEPAPPETFEPGERSLARKIGEYPEVIDKAVAELMPHHICTYLYELAQIFNRFYEQRRVVGDARQATRLALVERYADTLRSGLGLLGINAPDKM